MEESGICHFTDQQSFRSILREGKFRYSYAYERFNTIFTTGDEDVKPSQHWLIPVISFSVFDKHRVDMHNSYGSYGIVMNNAWARARGLNPVLYIESNSKYKEILSEEIYYLFDALKSFERKCHIFRSSATMIRRLSGLINLISYSKLSHGVNIKAKELDYPYYDEREWRIVLSLFDLLKKENGGWDIILPFDFEELSETDCLECIKERIRTEKEIRNNRFTARDHFIEFQASDIMHLVFKDEDAFEKVKAELRDDQELFSLIEKKMMIVAD